MSGRGTASLLNRSKAAGKASTHSSALRRNSTDWPSDDGATAVEDNDEEDEVDEEEVATSNIPAPNDCEAVLLFSRHWLPGAVLV